MLVPIASNIGMCTYILQVEQVEQIEKTIHQRRVT